MAAKKKPHQKAGLRCEFIGFPSEWGGMKRLNTVPVDWCFQFIGFPSEWGAKYGADTARMFILFKAPPEKDLEWEDADVEGQFRFLQRVWRLVQNYQEHPPQRVADSPPNERNLRRVIHQTIQAVTADTTGEYQFNTAIASLMKLTNELTDYQGDNSGIFDEGIRVLLTLL